MNIANSLKDIRLRKFEGYDISKMFGILSAHYQYSNSYYHISKPIKCFIASLFFDDYEYVYNKGNSSKLLFLYSHIFYRDDHFNVFLNLKNNVDNADFIYPVKREKRKLDVSFGIKNFFLSLGWIRELRKRGLTLDISFDITAELLQAYKFLQYWNGVECNIYKLLTVYYDASLIENMMVQNFNKKLCYTATLQHGIFCEERPQNNSFSFAGVEFNNTISDYFLAWNQFTKDKMLLTGASENRILILGIPKYIGYKKTTQFIGKTGVFGIVLNVKQLEQENIKLIQIANQLAKDYNLKYKLKYHPNFNGNEYDEYVDKSYYIGCFDKRCEITKYVQSVDFSLLSSSSVFVELVFLKHLLFRMSNNDITDKYVGLNQNSFQNYNDLKLLFTNLEASIKNTNYLFDYLCTTDNPKERYNDFFKGIINEQKEKSRS